MADVSKIKLPNNTEVNIKDSRISGVDVTPTSGSSNVVTSGGINSAIIESAGEVIIGTQTAATGNWTGVSKLATASDMKSGYRFTYWLPYAGSGNATLTLTFQDGTTKAINCYVRGASRLTTHIPAGNKIDFCYLENASVAGTSYTGAWIDPGFWDGNTYDRIYSNYERRFIYSTSTPLYRYKICGYNDGKIVPLTTTNQTSSTIIDKQPVSIGIDPSMGLCVYNTTTNITDISTAIGSIYDELPISFCQYTFNDNVPVYKDVYLKGTLGEDGLFYLDTTTHKSWYVFAPNRESDGEYNSVFEGGSYYMFVGPTYSSANYVQLKYNNPVYLYSGEKLVPLDEVKNTNIEEETEFLYRTSPLFPHENYLVSGIKGRTLAWNQLVKNKNYSYTATSSQAYYGSIGNIGVNVNLIKDHLYYISGEISRSIHSNDKVAIGFDPGISSSVGLSLNDGDPNKWYSRIIAASQNASSGEIYYNNYSGAHGLSSGDYITVNNLFLIDLTLMFGAGNEPSTVAEFEKLFPLPYYDYNPGELISNNAEAIKTVGFNQWDEEWESGDLSSGAPIANPSHYRSKNFYSCLPGMTLYIKVPHQIFMFYYDKNKNYINTYHQVDSSGTRNVPQGAFFFKFNDRISATYNNDICINISDITKNGTYEPYKSSILSLSIPSMTSGGVQVFSDGLRSAGNVYDEAYVDDDGFVRKVVKRIGIVDLGTLNWEYQSSYTRMRAAQPSDSAFPRLNTIVGNIVCSKYVARVADSGTTTKGISLGYNSSIGLLVYDSTYTDAATFKSAMSGVMLYYELATPIEYTLDVPIYVGSKFYLGGTQTVLPENTTTLTTAPFRGKFKYFAGLGGVQGMILAEEQKYLRTSDFEDSEFYFRESPESNKNYVTANKFYGKTIAWNQFLYNGNFANNSLAGWNQWGSCTMSASNGELSVTLTADATSSNYTGYIGRSLSAPYVVGHKLLFSLEAYVPKSGSFYIDTNNRAGSHYISVVANTWNKIAAIGTVTTASAIGSISLYPLEKTDGYVSGDTFKIRNVNVFNLTLMFGAGNEPATVEEFEKLFPLSYYEYSDGRLLSFNAEGIKTIGRNLWDEEWELGTYGSSDGNLGAVASSTQIRNVNPISVLPNTTYCLSCQGNSDGFYIALYDTIDSNKSGTGVPIQRTATKVKTFTTGANTRFACFSMASSYGTAYKQDICFSISDSSFNGQYEPYKTSTLSLNVPSMTSGGVQVFPDGMRSAGTVYDEAYIDDDGFVRKVVKRIGSVDLGTLTWTHRSEIQSGIFSSSSISGRAYGGTKEGVCSKYTFGANVAGISLVPQYGNKTFSYYLTSSVIYVYDTAYSDAAAFKTAMSGVMLYYELATPVEYTLDVPVYVGARYYTKGVQVVLPEHSSTPATTPFKGRFDYDWVSVGAGNLAAQMVSAYLPLTGGTMTGARPINFTTNKIALEFRPGHESYNARVQYMTTGNEALVLSMQNKVTSLIVKSGYSLANGNDWNTQFSSSNPPSIQVKGQSLYVNSFISSGTTPSYNFYVNGTSRLYGALSVSGETTMGSSLVVNGDMRISYTDAGGGIRTTTTGGRSYLQVKPASGNAGSLTLGGYNSTEGTDIAINFSTIALNGSVSTTQSLTLSGSTDATRRIYFGDTSHYLELNSNGFSFSGSDVHSENIDAELTEQEVINLLNF